MRVLVVGGSGYLGQHLLAALSAAATVSIPHEVFYTYSSSGALATAPDGVVAHQMDVTDTASIAACLAKIGPLDAVVNCAAVSQPAQCEKDPALSESINVPTLLVQALLALSSSSSSSPPPLLIQMSTDQVYPGDKAMSAEKDSPPAPVNVYGAQKAQCEEMIAAAYANSGGRYAILRSSIIYGGQTATPVPRNLFVQWLDSQLAAAAEHKARSASDDDDAAAMGGMAPVPIEAPKPITLFTDQYRCPVYVHDITRVVNALIMFGNQLLPPAPELPAAGSSEPNQCFDNPCIFNLGGPDRLNRLEMGEAIAAANGRDPSPIVPCTFASINASFASPADISMSSERLEEVVRFKMTTFREGLARMKF